MDWWKDIYAAFKAAAVKQVAYVPDAGHAKLIEACIADNDMVAVPLTSEEEGVAVLAGAWLGGERGVLLMQSSGVGNCINMLGLMRTCRFPLATFITMRGQWHEFNPWQVPMGQGTRPTLEAMDGRVPVRGIAEWLGDRIRPLPRVLDLPTPVPMHVLGDVDANHALRQ